MQIFRVEHPQTGNGPYDLETKLGREMAEAHTDDAHPAPYRDGIDRMSCAEFCGFADLDTLIWWFEDFLPQIEAEGYEFVIYEVCSEAVRFGEVQLVFRKEFAQRVDTI